MTIANQFLTDKAFNRAFCFQLKAIHSSPQQTINEKLSDFTDNTFQVIHENNALHLAILDTDFTENLILGSSNIPCISSVSIHNCNIKKLEIANNINISFTECYNKSGSDNRTISLINNGGKVRFDSVFSDCKLGLLLKDQTDLELTGIFDTINVESKGTASINTFDAKFAYREFNLRNIEVLGSNVFNITQKDQACFKVQNSSINIPVMKFFGAGKTSFKGSTIHGDSALFFDSNSQISMEDQDFTQIQIQATEQSSSPKLDFILKNSPPVKVESNKRKTQYHRNCKLILDDSDYELSLINCKLSELESNPNSSFRSLRFINSEVSSAKENNASFKKLRFFFLDSESSVCYSFFPKKINFWPSLRWENFSHHDVWMQSFIELRDKANQLKKEDDKDFFIWMSQHFRLMSTKERNTKLFLTFYKWTSSFGRNPFFPIMIWIGSVLPFAIVHFVIAIWPCLNLPSGEFYDFIIQGLWLKDVISFTLTGLFPLVGVEKQSLAHAVCSSFHNIISGVSFFLTGFCIRNHAKL